MPQVTDGAKELKTYVFVVLDRSGSMESVKSETISHFNEQLQTVSKSTSEKMSSSISLFTFNEKVQEVFFNSDAKSVYSLSEDSYKPDGMTAMLDAVGYAIERAETLEDIDDENTSCLMVVLTDGLENASKKYTYDHIAEKIQSLQNTDRWTFTYIGANQDLSKISKKLNIPKGNTLKFDSTSVGVESMSNKQNKYLGSYFTARSYGTTSTRGFYGSDEE